MLIRRGDRGEGVRDIQKRLLALGESIADDERGMFAATTEEAVRSFQQRRGLAADGIVGPETWRELVEASWRLGDRVLYLRAPPARGDDVRALQDRLATLGFHAGRVDGIFGAQTEAALREFQRNYGLPEDAILGEETQRALAGLPGLSGDTSIAEVREREALRERPRTLLEMRIVVDAGHGEGDPGRIGPGGLSEAAVAFDLAGRLEAVLASAGLSVFLTRERRSCPADSARAALANALDADIYLALHAGGSSDPGARGAATYFFGHERFRSESGGRLADLVLEELCRLGLSDGRAHPKTFAILRETRMPAVQVEPAYITNPEEERLLADHAFLGRIAEAIATALGRFAREPLPAGTSPPKR